MYEIPKLTEKTGMVRGWPALFYLPRSLSDFVTPEDLPDEWFVLAHEETVCIHVVPKAWDVFGLQ